MDRMEKGMVLFSHKMVKTEAPKTNREIVQLYDIKKLKVKSI